MPDQILSFENFSSCPVSAEAAARLIVIISIYLAFTNHSWVSDTEPQYLFGSLSIQEVGDQSDLFFPLQKIHIKKLMILCS